MPTFFQRYQIYRSLPGAVVFSTKQIRHISFILKSIYDKRISNPPIEFCESIEEGTVYRVRNYPENFVKTIDGLIDKFHITILKNINQVQESASKVVTEKPPASETTKKTEKRKRIPMKKPVYSANK